MQHAGKLMALLVVAIGATSGCGVSQVRKECVLSSVEAMDLAAEIANDECQRRFGQAPFSEQSFPIELRAERWLWGGVDPAGKDGFSAEVSFDACGGSRQVAVYYSSDAVKTLYR